MIEACPSTGKAIHLPLGSALPTAPSAPLLEAAGLELIRLVVPAGKEIPPHRTPGELTVQCLEGHVAFTHAGTSTELHAGDLLYVCANELHSVKALADSSLLVTRLRPHADVLPEGVD